MNEPFRRRVLATITDRVLLDFWRDEYERYSPLFRNEGNAPILNKIGQFPANPLLRGVVGHAENTFNVREAMDEGKIILVNLAKGILGEDGEIKWGQRHLIKENSSKIFILIN